MTAEYAPFGKCGMRFYQHGMTLLKDLRATPFRRTADSPARFFDHGGLGRERCLLCIEEFTLGREPVLFGLSIGAAICSPDLISALTNALRHGLIHWGTSFRLIRALGMMDNWLTKHYGGLVCIQGPPRSLLDRLACQTFRWPRMSSRAALRIAASRIAHFSLCNNIKSLESVLPRRNYRHIAVCTD